MARRIAAGRKPRGIQPAKRSDLVRYLVLGVKKEMIASYLKVSLRTVQRWTRHLLMFGNVGGEEPVRRLGRPSKLTIADGDALLDQLLDYGWLYHDEMVTWLRFERGVTISVGSTKRLLKKRGCCSSSSSEGRRTSVRMWSRINSKALTLP